jgi:hypothetical protein
MHRSPVSDSGSGPLILTPILRTLAIPITIPTADTDMDTATIHMGTRGVGATHSSDGADTTDIRITTIIGTPTDTEAMGMVIGDTVTTALMAIGAATEPTGIAERTLGQAIAAATLQALGDSRVAAFMGQRAVFTVAADTVDHPHLNFAPKT